MNSDPPWMINVTHTLRRVAASGQDADHAAPYSVYDLLRDLALLPQAAYYEKRGLHPLPPDLGWIEKRPSWRAMVSPAGTNASSQRDTEPRQGPAEPQPLDVLQNTVYRAAAGR